MKYTQIPANTFKEIQLNAGVLVDAFNPATGVIGNLIGATTGGINFTDTMNTTDFGEDIDNCPKNTKELKKLESHEVKMSGTFVTVTPAMARKLAGAADIDSNDSTHIIPRNDILAADFQTIWWIGDYSDENTGENAGFVAVKMINALSTGGFQIQSTDKGKGQFAFEFTGHYSINAQSTVPYEIYVKAGESSSVPTIQLNTNYVALGVGDTETLVATTSGTSVTVSFESDDTSVATVTSGGVVEGKTAGSCIITASITDDGVTYTDTCTVVVES